LKTRGDDAATETTLQKGGVAAESSLIEDGFEVGNSQGLGDGGECPKGGEGPTQNFQW